MTEMKTLTIGEDTYEVVDANAVHVTEQALTEEQQAQVKANIDAGMASTRASELLFQLVQNATYSEDMSETIDALAIQWGIKDKPVVNLSLVFGVTDFNYEILQKNDSTIRVTLSTLVQYIPTGTTYRTSFGGNAGSYKHGVQVFSTSKGDISLIEGATSYDIVANDIERTVESGWVSGEGYEFTTPSDKGYALIALNFQRDNAALTSDDINFIVNNFEIVPVEA